MIITDHLYGMECELKTDQLNVLILEKTDTFTGFIEHLEAQLNKVEEKILLYDDEQNQMDFSKKADVIFSVRDLTYQTTKMQKKVCAAIGEEVAESALQDRLVQNYAELLRIADDIKMESSYEVEYDAGYSFAELFKYLGMRLEEPKGTFCEKIMSYAKNCRDFLHIDVFFLINCKTFFKKEEYVQLQKWAAYQEICFGMVESDESRLPSGTNKYRMDEDGCLIH